MHCLYGCAMTQISLSSRIYDIYSDRRLANERLCQSDFVLKIPYALFQGHLFTFLHFIYFEQRIVKSYAVFKSAYVAIT